MRVVECQHCGLKFETQRSTRKFCSQTCSNRSAWKVTKTRLCRYCEKPFEVNGVRDANRQHCSRQCAKNHNAKSIRTWQLENPKAMKRYREARQQKIPGLWKKKWRSERLANIELLGGACAACGVTNPAWLHIDFIPTQKGEKYRHPRHAAFIRRHPELFRLLCANHHYELTLTGQIEGSDITQ